MTIGCNLDIAWFNITMQNGRLASMQVCERITHGCAKQDCFIFRYIAHTLHALT